MHFLLRIFGVSEGDKEAVKEYKSVWRYLICVCYRSFFRFVANHCIIPSLRVKLFRWSGIKIGNRVQINMNVNFMDDFCPDRICLEDEVSIGPFVSFIASSHPNNSILYRKYGISKCGRILVKSGAWLGVGSVVLPEVTIGEAAVIGANAVVANCVEDYAIMAGVPARKIGDVRRRENV